MKNGLIYLMLAFMAATAGLTGCGTIPKNPAETREFLEQNEGKIRMAVQVVRRLALRYAVENPEDRARISLQIDNVATQVGLLLSQGNFDPDAVTAALKIKEPYVADALDGLALAYNAAYSDLEQRDQAQLAIILLRAIADGLAPRIDQ